MNLRGLINQSVTIEFDNTPLETMALLADLSVDELTAAMLAVVPSDAEIVAEVHSLIAAAAPDMQFGTTAIQAALYQDDDAHDTCTLTACLNPLHPGPCKGWKGTLFDTAPGAFHALEKAKVEKANATRLKKIEHLKAQGLPIPKKLLAPIVAKPHPNAGKTASNATGQAHAAGMAVSNAAGVKTSEPGKVSLGTASKTLGQAVEKGPKGKKPTLGSKGIAFVIGQEKVTPQYKLDKAATITPEQWAGLPDGDKTVIRAELSKIEKDGFGPQQKKATELLAKLPAPEVKAKPTTIKEAKADGTLAKVGAEVAAKATPPVVKTATEPGKPPFMVTDEHLKVAPKAGAPKLSEAAKKTYVPPALKEAGPISQSPTKVTTSVDKPKALPKHVQDAIDMASGHAPGASWSKNHLAAYQKLSTEEFHALAPDTKTKIVAELKKGETKFLDPKKIQATKDLLAKFGKGPATDSTPKAVIEPKALEDVSFGKHFEDHSVTQAQAKQVAAHVAPTTLGLAAKKIAGISPAEDPGNPDFLKNAEDGASSLVQHGLTHYDLNVLKQPAVKDAIAKATQATAAELHARLIDDAKKKAFNKISQKLAVDGDKLSPIQKAALKQYQQNLLTKTLAEHTAEIDQLNAETKIARGALTTALQNALKDANAPKAQDMTGAQLDSKAKELLGADVVDPTKPKVSPSLANMQYAKKLATSEVDAEAKKYPAAVLADPAVAAKQQTYLHAVVQVNATQIAQGNLADHVKMLHTDAILSGEDVHGNPLSQEDKKILALHATKLAEDNKFLVSPQVHQQAVDQANEAKQAFHAAAEKVAAAPADPVTLSDYDKDLIGYAFRDAWGKHASKAVIYGVKTYDQQQKMKADPEYGQLTQDLGNLKALAGEVALAHAHEHTAMLNVPTNPDTGDLMHGPEYSDWKSKVAQTAATEKAFDVLHKTAQARLDAIRAGVGLKKRALPKVDSTAVKAAAAEQALYKTSGYSGPNYGKAAAAKSYMVAKLGDKLGVKHQSAAEKKSAKLGDTGPAASTAKIKNAAPAEPVKLGGDSSIASVPDALKKTITSDFKGMPSGKYLADPAEDIFDNLVNLAAAHGKNLPGGLSVDQVAKTVDETHSKNLGVANSGMLHKKITDWLGTTAGKQYAEGHTTPDAKVVKQISGELDLPTGVVLAPGEKVQKVAGPGPHDESLDHSAFKKASSVSAQVAQDQWMKDNGVKWSAQQKKALKSYTGSMYHTYNSYLRHGGSASTSVKQDIINIQSAMMPLAQHTLLKRGTGWDALPPEFHGFENAKKLIGKTIEEAGFTSTTVAGESGHFGGPLQLEIEAPKGTAAAFVNGISHYKNKENEMLLAAGTKYKILSVEQKGHQTVIRVRVVGDK